MGVWTLYRSPEINIALYVNTFKDSVKCFFKSHLEKDFHELLLGQSGNIYQNFKKNDNEICDIFKAVISELFKSTVTLMKD